MMRKKELKLVLTFHTTADAMAMEKACKEQNAPGRLIPVPRAISAGCGLAWCAGLDPRHILKQLMDRVGIEEQDMHECMILTGIMRPETARIDRPQKPYVLNHIPQKTCLVRRYVQFARHIRRFPGLLLSRFMVF